MRLSSLSAQHGMVMVSYPVPGHCFLQSFPKRKDYPLISPPFLSKQKREVRPAARLKMLFQLNRREKDKEKP